jgi:hypothetical protein
MQLTRPYFSPTFCSHQELYLHVSLSRFVQVYVSLLLLVFAVAHILAVISLRCLCMAHPLGSSRRYLLLLGFVSTYVYDHNQN